MGTISKRLANFSLILVAALALLMTNLSQGFASTVAVFPPDSSPYGKTYGQWSAEWWKWAVNTGFAAFSDTPESCNTGQKEPVWFLAGTFGGSAERICTVPEGNAIFFPIINALCGYTGKAPANTPIYAHRPSTGDVNLCEAAIDNTKSLEVSVDEGSGPIAIEDLNQFRFKSPVFKVPLGPDGQLVKVVSDGYWIMLEPLPPGEYSIHFKGVARQHGGFTVDVTYQITVE